MATRKTTPKATPLNAAEQSHADHAAALVTVQDRSDKLEQAAAALESLDSRRHNGDDTVTARQVRDAQDEVEHRNVLLNAARTKAKQAERAVVNTSTALADTLAPYLGEALGLTPSTTWEKYDASKQPESVPSAVLVQTEKETVPGDGFLSGSATFYFTRTRLHALPNTSALAESLEGMGVQARVSDGWTTKHEDESTTHSFQVKVEKLAPAVPVISATSAVSNAARQRVGFAIGESIESAHKMHESAREARRPSIGGNSIVSSNSLMGVLVKTGTPSLYSDNTDNEGTRTVTVLVNAECVMQYKAQRVAYANALQTGLSAIVEKAVGTMVAGAGRISATQVQAARIADDQASVAAQVLVSYISTLPQGQAAATVEAPSRKPSPADSDYLEPG